MENHLQPFEVCVVCALPEEARAFLEAIHQQCKGAIEEGTSPRHHYSYRLAMLKNDQNELLNLHISWPPRYGPQEMTLHLSYVLEECQPCIAIMTGICAGDAQHVQLGDLVVAERIFAYDAGKFMLDDDGRRVYLHNTTTYQLDASILHFLGLFDDWKPLVARLPPPSESELKCPEFRCHIKAMASGSAVRADHPFEDVRTPVRDTVAIDMEGAAFGLVMSRNPLIPWLVVKGVCDYADQDKNDTYHDYAARASALYALSFIQSYVTSKRLPQLAAPLASNQGAPPHKEPFRPKESHRFPSHAQTFLHTHKGIQRNRVLWKIIAFLGMATILSAVASITAIWLTGSQSVLPADIPFRQLLAAWPITLSVGCSLLLLASLTWLLSRWYTHETTFLSEQNYTRMLHKLQNTYRDLLVQSLEGAVWVELGFKQKPDAVLTSAHLLLCLPDQPEQDLLPGTSILQVYIEAQGELLILGQPGAGKSTLLLSLAQQLVEQALGNTTQPLPIILPLSSWAIKRQPLQDWGRKQIAQIYHVSPQVCEQWIQHNQILLLLDGLDEMEKEARPACVAAIDAYHDEYMMPLVVCSRVAEYIDASKHQRLALQRAIIVRPLTKEQVDRHLAQVGAPVAALRKALRPNPKLQELATTPLMLNVLMLTYQGTSVRNLSKKGEALQQQVFDNYFQRMVERRGNNKLYPIENTRRWLSWLAYQLRKHNQTIFYPERLQPDWLPAEQQRIYTWLAVRLPGALIGVLAGLLTTSFLMTFDPGLLFQYSILSGFLGAVFSVSQTYVSTYGGVNRHWWRSGHLTPAHLAASAMLALVWGAVFMFNLCSRDTSTSWLLLCMYSSASGLTIGLSCLLLMFLLPQSEYIPIRTILQNKGWWSSIRRIVSLHGRRALLAATIFGIGIWLSDGLSNGLSNGLSAALNYGLSNGLSAALNYGLLSVMVSVILGTLAGDIHLTERLKWTRRSLLRSLFSAKHFRSTLVLVFVSLALFGLGQGLGPLLNQGLDQGLNWGLGWGLSQGLSWGLSCGLSCWFLLGLFQGISHEQIEDQDRRLFNQGIRDSFRNSVFMSIISAILIEVLSVLSWGMSYELSYGLSYGLNWGLSYELTYELGSGLSIGLNQGLSHAWLFAVSGGLLVGTALSGGLAVLRHYILRFLLQCAHIFPWKAHSFLEDAGRRILLRCIDGKYSFTHRLLQDHFADHATSAPAKERDRLTLPDYKL